MNQPKLQRRDFMSVAGITMSAAGLGACASSAGVLSPIDAQTQAAEDCRRTSPQASLPPILRALAIGLNAPSPHNTQSWLFDIVSNHEALLRIDRRRLIPKTDPPARQIHIGCGCFVEAFALGASGIGRAAEVELFPYGEYGSAADMGSLPVARLRLTHRIAAAHPLSPFVFSRQTSRHAYTGEWVSAHAFGEVLKDAHIAHADVRLITKGNLAPYLKLLDRAMTIESTTIATNEETRRWMRFTSDEAASSRDGLTFEAVGITGLDATFARWFIDDTKEAWNSEDTVQKGLENFREALYSARGLVLLSTTTNTIVDQVAMGRDCYQLMLALTKHGYFCHPTSQVTQEYMEMDAARLAFSDLSQIREPSKVQMILRIGRSPTPFMSYRRPLGSFVREPNGGA